MITNEDDAMTPPHVATKLKDAGCRREISIAHKLKLNLVELELNTRGMLIFC
jgi:hypothetical protein